MAEFIITGIMTLPLLIILIYGIIHPEELASWGYKWRYKGEPEPTEEYIKYTRASSVIGLLLTISIIIIYFNSLYGLIFFILSIPTSLYYFLTK
jgi:hypothetical protein